MMVETYLDSPSSHSTEKTNTEMTSNCGKMPFKGDNLLFTRAFMSSFFAVVQSVILPAAGKKNTPEVRPFTLTTKTKITCGMILFSV